jgi:hypothetical protein
MRRNVGTKRGLSELKTQIVGTVKKKNHAVMQILFRLFRLFRQLFEGGRKEKENHAPSEGVASENNCATKTHPINPIAICLLLSCCNKATFSKRRNNRCNHQPSKRSATDKSDHGRYSVRSMALIHTVLFIHSLTHRTKGVSCQGCKHIEMEKILTNERLVYRFVCSQQHQILKLSMFMSVIAPESCRDYLPTA